MKTPIIPPDGDIACIYIILRVAFIQGTNISITLEFCEKHCIDKCVLIGSYDGSPTLH